MKLDTLRIRCAGGVVEVPCRLLDASYSFEAYLPSRGGVRQFTAFLDSRNVAESEITEVVLATPEVDPRGGDGYALDADELAIANEAASDVAEWLLSSLGAEVGPEGFTFGGSDLRDCAETFRLECSCWTRTEELNRRLGRPLSSEPSPAEERNGEWVSRAARLLEVLVTARLDGAIQRQRIEAHAEMARAQLGGVSP